MATSLVLTTAAPQVARTINDVIRATATASIATIAREGPSPHVLGFLVQSTADLLPNPPLVEGLMISHNVEGSWTSAFMANFMGVQQRTTQQLLLELPVARPHIIYVTALAAATSSSAVRGLLREHIALTLGLSHVAEVPENIYHTLIHSPTLKVLQKDVAENLERCKIAFSTIETGSSQAASYRELAVIAKTFGKAQTLHLQKGTHHWVRVKNLIGAEALCAALSVAFKANIVVDFMNAVFQPPDIKVRPDKYPFSNESYTVSIISSTTIRFEYDDSGVASISLCETGGSVREYIVPGEGLGRLQGTRCLGERY